MSKYSWEQAQVLTATFGGKSDWRLPTITELQSLVIATTYSPTISSLDPVAFPGQNSIFWSASTDASSSVKAFYLNAMYGSQASMGKGNTIAVHLVSGTPSSTTTTNNPNTTTTTVPSGTLEQVLPSGWNLLGNSLSQTIQVANLYKDAAAVTSVWKWSAQAASWQFYTPSKTAEELTAYVADKGYGVLTEIKPREGYWLNALKPMTVTLSGQPVSLAAGDLVTGWNLVSTADEVSPAALNLKLSDSVPGVGESIPNNFTTLWAWDNAAFKWYFYAPSLDSKTLSDYIISKGYLDFTLLNKTLGKGMGFWINKVSGPVTIDKPKLTLSMTKNDGSTTQVSTVSNTAPAKVTAILLDATSQPLQGKVVTFSLADQAMATLTPASGTALTDAAGIANITLAGGSSSGATTITAEASVGSDTVSSSLSFAVVGSMGLAPSLKLELTNPTTGTKVSSLSADAPAKVTATLLDAAGQSIPGKVVAFSLSDEAMATMAPASGTALTGDDGKASIILTGSSISGATTVTGKVTMGSTSVEDSLSFTVTGGSPPIVTASTVQLLVSSPQMLSSGITPTDLTAVVLNDQGQVLAGRTVNFSALQEVSPNKVLDPSAYINNISTGGISDANGIVTAKLMLGSEKSNREIIVSATCDTVVKTNKISVVNTSVGISGNTSIAFNDSTKLTISLKDAASVAIPEVPVTVTSKTGNTIEVSQATTDSSGSIVATVTVTKLGNDVITVQAGGVTKTQALTISSASFNFTAPEAVVPLTTPQIYLNTPTDVSLTWIDAGTPQAGKKVTFSSSRGSFDPPNPATTDGDGGVTVKVSSNSAGPAIITAYGPGGTPSATKEVLFVANTASTVTIQALPAILKPTTTTAGQNDNVSTISAVVRDEKNNLVKDARVTFSIVEDPTSGELSSSTAVTDVSGTASVNYTSGNVSSPQNGVIIRATVNDINGEVLADPVPAPADATLTVGGSALFVRLGTDNQVTDTPPTNLSKTYSALVTDAAGNPVPAGTTVHFVLRPEDYRKGSYELVPIIDSLFSQWVQGSYPNTGGVSSWVQGLPTTCVNEDVNFNGIIDPPGDEDFNHNGVLDPGGVASVNPTAITDANGFATATVAYPKDHAGWVQVLLEARAGVAGNDPPNSVSFVLAGLAEDYVYDPTRIIIITPPPAGRVSPYGISDNCLDKD